MRLNRDHSGNPGLEDAGLLARDVGERDAQLVGVIHRDRHDHVERRPRDNVGGVEPAAETDFQDDGVGRMLGEGQEGGGRRDLEIGDRVAGIDALRMLQAIDQLPLGNRACLAVGTGKLDALVEAHEMRRGVDVHALAGGLQHGFQKGCERALAVGAGDVNHRRQAILRIAELGQQRLDTAERKVDQPRMQRLEFGQDVFACAHGYS